MDCQIKYFWVLFWGVLIMSSCFSSNGTPKPTGDVAIEEYKEPTKGKKNRGEVAVASMSTSKKKKLRRDIVKYGKKLLGVRYQSTGKNPSQGFDCSGFTSYVYQHFGISIGSSSRAQAQEGKRIAVQKAQEGDLIIFADKGRINHVAMVVSNDSKGLMVIHSTSRGIVVDDMLQSKYWKPRMMYARTILGQ